MDWLTFFAEVIKALAWPAATITIVVLLRKPLGKLVPLLKKVKYGEMEAEFGEKVKAVEKEAEKVLAPEAVRESESPLPDNYLHLLNHSPNAAVMYAWNEVEFHIKYLLMKSRLDLPSPGPLVISDFLASHGLLDPDEQWTVENLRELRNIAAYSTGESINRTDAETYVRLALSFIDRLAARLEKLLKPEEGAPPSSSSTN